MKLITPIYRDKNATELNELLKELLNDLQLESEGLSECLMDLTLDHSERRVKTDGEITPSEQAEIAIIRTNQNVLDRVISNLKDILYSDYEETSIDLSLTERRAPNMNKEESMEWIGSKVKPFILEEVTKQTDIAKELHVDPTTITKRLNRVFGKEMNWKRYVEKVQQQTL